MENISVEMLEKRLKRLGAYKRGTKAELYQRLQEAIRNPRPVPKELPSSYRELQAMLTSHGIPASGPLSQLRCTANVLLYTLKNGTHNPYNR